jgi:ADP-ribosylglycohydrolase
MSLDFLSTPITSLSIVKKRSLRRVRASFCPKLTHAIFKKLPNLEAIELLSDDSLTTLTISNCPRLRALDLSASCVKALPRLDSLEYLSLGEVVSLPLPPLVHLKFLDYTPDFDPHFPDLTLFPELEVFRFRSPTSARLSYLSSHPTLRIFNGQQLDFSFDSVAPATHLEFLSLYMAGSVTGEVSVATDRGIFVGMHENRTYGAFDATKLLNFRYVTAAHLLYGPWGVPDVDAAPLAHATAVVRPPSACDVAAAVDGVIGTIFGGAIGDCLGVGVEFVDGSLAKCWFPEPIDATWSHPRITRHNHRFLRGTPTDDTSQALLILRALVAGNAARPAPDGVAVFAHEGVIVDVTAFAARLKDWVEHGHSEHKQPCGLGCGKATYQTLSHPQFDTDPIAAAVAVWEKSGRASAANGSVMRVSTSGAFAFWDEQIVSLVADKFGRATHPDPRCVLATNAAARLIARLLQARSGIRAAVDIDATIAEVRAEVPGIEEHAAEVDRYIAAKTLEELELSGNGLIGYCLKTFGCALWALRYAASFEDGIARIIREGGDSDTNASAAGALLGAKFGFAALPKDFVDHLFVGNWLWREVGQYLELMGLPVPESPYLAGTDKEIL